MNTLKGVFNTQKPVHRKNFIKENVRQLREMQICWQNAEEQRAKTANATRIKGSVPQVSTHAAHPKLRNQPHYARSLARATKSAPPKPVSESPDVPSQQAAKPVLSDHRKQQIPLEIDENKSEEKLRPKGDVGNTSQKKRSRSSSKPKMTNRCCGNTVSEEETESESTSRGCQTLDPSNMDNLYYEGVIKYPSSRKSPERAKPNFKLVPTRDMALQTDDTDSLSKRKVNSSSNSSAMGDMKTNDDDSTVIKNIADCQLKESSSEEENEGDATKLLGKKKSSAGSTTTVDYDQLKAPPTYQKGVVPKYLRDRQEEWRQAAEKRTRDVADPSCPPGHIPLPETDRKDTLKMLKKSYADLVLKLNMLPVRSDSLKTRQTKMQLEEQLNKLEEGIKVFSRPKVYVKVGG
ncbi:micronuclear linker histone polyprotein isoform X2 [Anabrus simplex]